MQSKSDMTPTRSSIHALRVRHSLHEEYVAATLELAEGRIIDLGARAHHQILLELARARLRDRAAGVTPAEEGWIHRDDLTVRLGTDEQHINVLIHRARSQIRKSGVCGAESIVERRQRLGELRLGTALVVVGPL